jgi:hypothetical protein
MKTIVDHHGNWSSWWSATNRSITSSTLRRTMRAMVRGPTLSLLERLGLK